MNVQEADVSRVDSSLRQCGLHGGLVAECFALGLMLGVTRGLSWSPRARPAVGHARRPGKTNW